MNESYTAYGDRRNPTTWNSSASSIDLSVSAGVTRQGYTWQTALGNMGLNHMNGRVQDAITGVFLSPDPYISEPGNPQNYNRYSYVYNNPMSHTDPSGFSSIPSYELETVTVTAYVTDPCPDCEEIIVYGRSPDWNLGGIRQQQPGSILTGDSNGYPYSGTNSTQLPKLVQATKVTDKASLVPQSQKQDETCRDTIIGAATGAGAGAVEGKGWGALAGGVIGGAAGYLNAKGNASVAALGSAALTLESVALRGKNPLGAVAAGLFGSGAESIFGDNGFGKAAGAGVEGVVTTLLTDGAAALAVSTFAKPAAGATAGYFVGSAIANRLCHKHGQSY